MQNIGEVSFPKYNFDDRFTDLETKKFVEIFNYLDRDGNGQLRVNDLALAMRSMGTLVTDEEVSALIKKYDRDNIGVINLNDFK